MMEESSQLNAKQTKRQWTSQEDVKLVECLIELAATSWKCENGTFKSGYTRQLEKMINKKLPGCGIKANPHVESKIKMLKKHYFAIVEMMGPAASRFGWNDKDKVIVVEKEIYKEWVKSHPNAAGLYNKPFPHLEDLEAVFGKDRAQGANAKDPAEAATTMEAELEAQLRNYMHMNENMDLNVDEIEAEFETDYQVPESMPTTPGAMSSSSNQDNRKRKRADKGKDVLESLVETIGKIGNVYEKSSSNISEFVSCFKHEKEGVDRRMSVPTLLKEIEGLSNYQRVKTGKIITQDPHLTDYLFSLAPEDRLELVFYVLDKST